MPVVNRVAMRQPEPARQPRFEVGTAESQAAALVALEARRLAWIRARHNKEWRAIHKALKTVRGVGT